MFSEGPNGPWLKVLLKKLHKVKCHIQVALSLRWVTAQFLAKIGGECIAMMRAVLPAKLLLWNLYHMLSYRSSWDSVLEVSEACIKDLMWWRDALMSWNGAPLCKRAVEIQVETDALKTGWGGMTMLLEASGMWTKEVSFQPSNYHKLLAVLKTLQSLKTVLEGKVVQVLSDNITTVCYINSLGGPSPLMTRLMKVIFTHVHENRMVLLAKFLARSRNCHADRLSRQLLPYEWKIHPQLFKCLDERWGPHTVDRFASDMTAQISRYNSLFYDTGTSGVDALAQTDWDTENNFINLLFWLIPKILKEVTQTKCVATIIAPHWPSQPWFRKLQQMSVDYPVRIPNHPNVMLRRIAVPEPMKNTRWKIFAWRISGLLAWDRRVGQMQQYSNL